MLPTLQDFGIACPVYIRKINSRAHWNPEGTHNNYDRARQVAERLFQSSAEIYSLWRIGTNQDFYSVVAALSAFRSPRNQDIDFIWLTVTEAEALGLKMEPIKKGECVHAEPLHFNARIDRGAALALCQKLVDAGREAYRCKRGMTTKILETQVSLGCKALVEGIDRCQCEAWKSTP
jgi:hypothetical protein